MTRKILLLLALGCFIALCFAPHTDPTIVHLDEALEGPSRAHLLGTDPLGRDLFALMKAGSLRSLLVVLVGSAVSVFLGVGLGLLGGSVGGLCRELVRLFADFTLIIPSFILALILASLVGLSPLGTGLILGVLDSGNYIHQVMALVERILEAPFLLALEKLTIPRRRRMGHILRNLAPVVKTNLGNRAGGLILTYAGLAFVGLGTDMTAPDWGTMLYQYRLYLFERPGLILWPSLGIAGLSALFMLLFDKEVES